MACQYCMTSAVGRCQYCGPQGAATVAHDWDQLQQQLDALRAEVERLRENSAGLYVSNTQLQARAEAAERERDEAQAQARHWREAAVTENERAMEYLNAVAEAQAHAAWFKKVPA